MANTFSEINITNYILEDFNVLKLTAPAVNVVFLDKTDETLLTEKDVHGQLKCSNLTFPFAKEGYKPTALPIKYAAVLVEADAIRKVKKVLEIVFDSTSFDTLEYTPGDTIGILPRNTEEDTCFLLKSIELQDKANEACQVQVNSSNSKKNLKFLHIPQCTTPTEVLRDILNIRAVPKKQFLRALAYCCIVKEEQDFLNSLASKEGSHYYNELILEKGITLVGLLKLCGSCKPTLSLLIEHLPRLLPRPYSIANSPITHKHELKIIFSILKERPGVTTAMLASMANVAIKQKFIETPTVLVYPRQSNNFCYTADDYQNNQILVAIGTGVSPFLGFLEHKSQLLISNRIKPGATWLFVGATVEEAIPHREVLYELIEKSQHRVLGRYFESFSREPDAVSYYVQEQFIAYAQELVEFLLKKDTILYVCADGACISKSIEFSLSFCLQRELGLTEDDAQEMLKLFRSKGKYREDLWT